MTESLSKGQRVVMTDEAIRCGLDIKKRTGTVATTKSSKTRFICVRVDGHKTIGYYHPKFWEPLTDSPL